MKVRLGLISVAALGVGLALGASLGLAQGPGTRGDVGAQAEPAGTSFTYQGHLVDDGEAVSGAYDFQFRLYDDSSDGLQVGGTFTKDDVEVSNGLFTVELDFGAGVFQGDARWLEIGVRPGASIGAYTTLAPRQPLIATPYAQYALSAPWSGLSGVPPGFEDGEDDDTTYAAGAGLALSGTQFSAVFAGTGVSTTIARSDHDHDGRYYTQGELSGGSASVHWDGLTHVPAGLDDGDQDSLGDLAPCDSGQVPEWDDGLSQWVCGDDDDTTYGAGTGLELVGTTFSADTGYLQRRVSGTCDPGSSIRVIDPDGTVTCESDSNTTYAAGNQLQLVGTTFNVLEGSGSGLDADLLDGQHASAFAGANHDHLGETWTGSDNPLKIEGSFSYPHSAPLMLSNSGLGHGLEVASPGWDGVHVVSAHTGLRVESAGWVGVSVGSASFAGVYVGSADEDGVRVVSAGDDGVEVSSAGSDGVDVDSAGHDGLQVSWAGWNGVRVDSAGDNGVVVHSAGHDGVAVGSAGWRGVDVYSAGGDGFRVCTTGNRTSCTDDPGNHGLEVGSAQHDGVHVNLAAADGVHVALAGSDGMRVDVAGGDGVYLNTVVGDGVRLVSAGGDGVRVDAAGANGVHVGSAVWDGVRVDSAGSDGVDVASADGMGMRVGWVDLDGVYVHSANGDGFSVGSAGRDGVHVLSAAGDGLEVDSAGGNGLRVDGAGGNGVEIWGATWDGVQVNSAGRYGVQANTDGAYGFFTGDSLYVGGKIDSVGPVDPIIGERFEVDPQGQYEVGDLLVIDPDSPYLVLSGQPNDTKAIGVVGPCLDYQDGELMAIVFGWHGANPHEDDHESVRSVARIKADASYGTIKRGDLLTTSPTTGHAMKAQPVDVAGVEIYRPGTIIGKALESLDSGRGLIELFVVLQ